MEEYGNVATEEIYRQWNLGINPSKYNNIYYMNDFINSHRISAAFNISHDIYSDFIDNKSIKQQLYSELTLRIAKEISKLTSFHIEEKIKEEYTEYTNELVVFSPKEFKELIHLIINENEKNKI